MSGTIPWSGFPANPAPLGWVGIVRLGLVQASLGAIVVLTTSTLNRVMVVEFALPALLPGALIALHYAVQLLRPRMGFGSDMGGRSTPWIAGGMVLLAAGGIAAAAATALMATSRLAGILLAIPAYAAVGAGVGAAGTSLLALLAKRVTPERRAPAATILWLLMILGIAAGAIAAGKLLDPFSPGRLLRVVALVELAALTVSLMAVNGVEAGDGHLEGHPAAAAWSAVPLAAQPSARPSFATAIAEIWAEQRARRFAIFVFVSMLAYNAQELILEPFAGAVFGMSPGQSARLTGLQNGGVLAGMLLVAIAGALAGGFRTLAMRRWTIGGCTASAIALLALATAGLVGPAWPLRTTIVLLGAANGAFTIAAIGAMMGLAGTGRERREGTRMGLWGAAQAIAFGVGGLAGTGASDIARRLLGAPSLAYAVVFACEALLFLLAAGLAGQIFRPDPAPIPTRPAPRSAALAG